METKEFAIKSVSKGQASVVIATLNTVDKDGDLTLPGAFGSQKAKILPAHDWSHLSLGVASISEVGNQAIADLRFNMAIPSAAEWFESLKFAFENGVAQQFSYGYDVLDSDEDTIDGKRIRVLKKLKVHEVSPVVVGAGVNTRVLDVKTCQSCAAGKTAPKEPGLLDKITAAIDVNDALLSELKKYEPYFAKGRIPAVGDDYVKAIRRLNQQIEALAAKVAPPDPDRFADPALVIAMRATLARRVN